MALRFFVVIALTLALLTGVSGIVHSQNDQLPDVQSLRQEIDGLNKRISSIENSIDSGVIAQEIETANDELRELYDGLNDIGRQVSLGQMFLSGQFFVIFGTLLAAASIATGIVSATMLKGVNAYIRQSVKSRVENDVISTIDDSSHYVIAKTHGQQAFAWWDHYHYEFQKFLRGQKHDASIIRDIRLSKDIAHKGLSELSKLSGSLRKERKTAELEAALINHWVYNRTAEALLQTDDGEQLSENESNELVSKAVECMPNIRKQPVNRRWYNHVETAQFCLLKFGSEAEKSEARKYLLSLFEADKGKFRNVSPKPDPDFLALAYGCYFPVNESTGKRTDLHGLGRVPDETWNSSAEDVA